MVNVTITFTEQQAKRLLYYLKRRYADTGLIHSQPNAIAQGGIRMVVLEMMAEEAKKESDEALAELNAEA